MNLKEAIQHLYEVFKSYPLKGGLRERSCECCVSGDEIRELISQPLEKLTAKKIGHFARSVVSTFGDIEDLKHFLPRILELMMFSNNDVLDDFLTFEKLNYSEWETWNVKEIQAVDDYFFALWKEVVSNECSTFNQIENTLTIVSKYSGLNKALLIWENSMSRRSVEFIIDSVMNSSNLDLSEENLNLFMNWLSQKQTLQKIEQYFFETEDKDEANRISIAYTLLEKNRQ